MSESIVFFHLVLSHPLWILAWTVRGLKHGLFRCASWSHQSDMSFDPGLVQALFRQVYWGLLVLGLV